jgi:hypothetical protein
MRKMTMLAALLLLIVALTSTAAERRITVPIEDSPSLGPENAPVTIVEFIDFQ